jgi:hypothetical protein
MFQTKVPEKIKKSVLFSVTFFENSAVDEKMWKNTVEPDRPQMTIWPMSIACRITKATHTHTHTHTHSLTNVILIAFPL